jgi:hypothetical protein
LPSVAEILAAPLIETLRPPILDAFHPFKLPNILIQTGPVVWNCPQEVLMIASAEHNPLDVLLELEAAMVPHQLQDDHVF